MTITVADRPGRWFSWPELTESATARRLGIDNIPGQGERDALRALVVRVLDPLRDLLGVPLVISSGYRSVALNRAIGGTATSQHTCGEAADLHAAGIESEEVMRRLAESDLPFRQAIWYPPTRGGHVHVSHWACGPHKRETLYAPEGGGYQPWTPS